MDDQKKQIIEKLKQANNILVTVKNDPSIDQLAACIGLTLVLNELGKHATAVFSGEVPSVLEFLQPEKTLEANTDSLRDFIIALDKSKADKLRYKVEDKVVKIFITPYKTSITDKDLEFSQGDFNVDVVVALGVHNQDELDQAITAHGRILHDATVMSINTTEGDKLGTINWQGKDVSSLSEMVASIVDQLGKKDALDNQVATAFLTGIVSETERFSNNKTTPQTMSVSAKLLTAGANQELVASKLAEPAPVPEPQDISHDERDDNSGDGGAPAPMPDEPPKPDDGTLSIDHTTAEPPLPEPVPEEAPSEQENGGEQAQSKSEAEPMPPPVIDLPRATAPTEPQLPPDEQAAMDLLKNRQIKVDEHGSLQPIETEHRDFLGDTERPVFAPGPDDEEQPAGAPFSSKIALTPPVMGGTLTANSRPEGLDPAVDPLSPSRGARILSHERPGVHKDDEEKAPVSKPEEQPAPAVKDEKPSEVLEPPKPEPAPEPKAPEPPKEEESPKAPAPKYQPPEPPAEKQSEPAPAPAAPTMSVPEPAPAPPPTPTSEPATQAEPLIAPAFPMTTTPPVAQDEKPKKTLADIEEEVHAHHTEPTSPEPPKEETAPSAPAAEILPPTPEAPAPAPSAAEIAAAATPSTEAHPALQAALQDTQPAPIEPASQAEASVQQPATTAGGKLEAQPFSPEEIAAQAKPADEPAPASQPTTSQKPGEAPQLEAQTMDMPLPPTINVPPPNTTPPTSSQQDSSTAPPVPPPFMPLPPQS